MFIALAFLIPSALQRSAMCIEVFNYMPLLTERNTNYTGAIYILLLRSKESGLLN